MRADVLNADRFGSTVTIGVYRIFVGSTWTAAEAVERLVRGFDAIPEFLYRLDRLPADIAALAGADLDMRKSLMRIAMTQSHAMLLLTGPQASDDGIDASLEVSLARTGFRRRLPVIEIASDSMGGFLETRHPAADVTVGWDALAIACAVQEMSAQAGADWRAQTRSLLQNTSSSPPSPVAPADATAQRPHADLPVAAINRAYDDLRAQRTGRAGGRTPR